MSDDLSNEAAWFEAQAVVLDERAARVMRHAVQAHEEADRDAADGKPTHQALRLREAKAHERSATVIQRTAALYRARARDLRGGQQTHP